MIEIKLIFLSKANLLAYGDTIISMFLLLIDLFKGGELLVLTSFASIIFEMKKPVKNLLIKTINEKYGINVQNLKEVASFRGLVETQIVIN